MLLQVDNDIVCRPFNRGCLLSVPFHGIWTLTLPFNRGCLYIVSTIWTLTVFAGLSTGAVYCQYHFTAFGHRHCLSAFLQGLFIVSTISWHLDIDIVCQPFNRGCLYIVSTIWTLTVFAGLSTGAVYCQYHLDVDSVCRPFNRGCLLSVPFGH